MSKKKHLLPVVLVTVWVFHMPCLAAEMKQETYAVCRDGENAEPEAVRGEAETARKLPDAAARELAQSLAEGKRIQRAVMEGLDCILVYRDALLEEPICIPPGRSVSFDAADGTEVFLRRAEGYAGSLFELKEGAKLTLGGKSSGMLVLEHTDGGKVAGALIRGSGTVRMGSGVRVMYGEETSDRADDMTVHADDMPDRADNMLVYADDMPDHADDTLLHADDTAAYSDNKNAGTALVTGTEREEDTGTKSASFFMFPQSVLYAVEDQEVESGAEISEIAAPQTGTGADGTAVKGTLLWLDAEGGTPLPEDLLLSGSEGEVMELYWEFLPENPGYAPVFGKVNLTFREPAVKENEKIHLNLEEMNGGWEDGVPNTGGLSDSASAQGSTSGEGISWQEEGAAEEAESGFAGSIAAALSGETEETAKSLEAHTGEMAAGTEAEIVYTPGGGNPKTGEESGVFFWTLLLAASFLVSTERILSIIMGRIEKKSKG